MRRRDNSEDLWRRLMGEGREGGVQLPQLPGGLGRLLWMGAAIVVAILWLVTGVYMVGPGSQGVIRRFGKEVGRTGPGLHYHLPWPIETVGVVNMEEVRTLAVGFIPATGQSLLHEAIMITADQNLVSAQMVVQYRVKDASNWLFKVQEPENTVKAAAEVALRGSAGNTTIDDIVTVKRTEVEVSTQEFLQKLVDDAETGVQITAVKLQKVDPPEEVAEAFHEVVRAREDKEKLIREAEAYREDLLPKARGEAEKTVLEAEAYKQQRIIRAQGDAEKFLAVLEEYQKSPDVTRKRLYLETVERILPDLEKIVIDSESGDLLQLLPLKELAETEKATSPTP